jgi:O-antigen ligase
MSTRPVARANRPPVFDTSPLSFSGIVADYGLIGAVGIGALLLAVVLAPLIGGYPPGASYGADISLNALRALICVAGLCRPRLAASAGNENRRGQTVLSVLFSLTAGLTALSLLVHSQFLTSPVLLFAMLPATLNWLCYALLTVLVWQLARQDKRIVLLLAGALTIGATGTAIAVARSYGEAVQTGMKGFRASGTFFSPNFAGGFLGLCLPILAAACLAARERVGALVLGTVTALTFGALVATGSRAGVGITGLGLIVGIGLALLSRPKGEPGLPWARIGALIAAFAILGFAFRGPLTARAEGGGSSDEHSGQFRTMTWKGTAAMAKAYPLLGVGPGTFYVYYPAYAIVARTDLAHSSYLEIAGEQGFPALLTAVVAVLAALATGLMSLFRREKTDDDASPRLLLCGIVGGVIVGSLRSLFDSEWTLLGNGVPFWTAIGLVTAGIPALVAPSSSEPVKTSKALFLRVSAALGLVFALVLLQGAQTRDMVQAQYQQTRQYVSQGNVWPPDPNIALYTGKPEEAAQIEPSGKRWYQLAESLNRAGKPEEAIEMYHKAAAADPNAMQTWRKLAVTLQEQGKTDEARKAWTQITTLDEGLVGQVRAIPELRETHPAFAYAALAEDAAKQGEPKDVEAYFEKAAKVIEDYSKTSPQYQQMELLSALVMGTDVEARRQESRDLYESVIRQWIKLQPERKAELEARRDEAVSRLDKFAKPETAGTMNPEQNTPK